ncbi:hypothetical protein E5673_08960 [Sphingomonas sp. PAMC26645]|uniref:hypothetical protein n=1 Tax=Sphingomonas sp. PAMC26645 TaxID=2565555 RepID=UPI00109D8E66|nr:hypothetical protein [Sphingomonas sp. PAMC26645]QCB42344.1 hypothetical protein E5673_08960 [Sphingomonas sp. PAMC26645]
MDVSKLANRQPADSPVAEYGPAPESRRSQQLRIFLGEIRAGADVRSASVVADIRFFEAQEHAVAEARGEYADIVSIEPTWRITGPSPIFESATATVENGFEKDGDAGDAAEDDAVTPSTPRVFDFAIAQVRESVMQAIVTLASAPPPSDVADIWAEFVGHGIPAETISSAVTWLGYFNSLFPEAEARRQQSVAAMMEKL